MDKSMLIDFNSPAHKNELTLPLIPVPPSKPSYSNEVNQSLVDPFEVEATLDPFEDVLKHATTNSNNGQTMDQGLHIDSRIENLINIESQCCNSNTSIEDELQRKANPVSSCPVDNVLDKTHLECDEILISIESESKNNVAKLRLRDELDSPSIRDNLCKKSHLEGEQVLHSNEISKDCNGDLKNSQNIPQVSNCEQIHLKCSPKPSIVVECDSQSQTSTDFSTDEGLKAVIAKRVNKCIQEVLNGSLKTNSIFKKPQNKRSLSFIGLSSTTIQKEPDRLNKSCTDVNSTSEFKNQQLDTSSDSSGFGVLSPNSTDVSIEGNEEEKVFKEARKLSRTFSKLAESLRQEQESESDDEDLISCKPRWLYTESSEDEEEKLLKDPTLNIRRRSSSTAFTSPAPDAANTKGSDSPALLAFKSRRSFTQLQAALDDTKEEITMKRSGSVGSQMKQISAISNIASIGPVNFIKIDEQPLKLRKNFGVVKKGPLRAVMPIQNMTKEPLSVAGRISSKQDTSPEARYQKSGYVIGTPSKDSSQLNITPMASSTPNKADGSVNNTSLLTRPVATNKRHSLEGNVSSHKSREAQVTEEGARPRSNSVNSSIPRVMQVKPFTGLPVAPKSTSSLLRTTKALINGNNSPNTGGKKNTTKLKTNTNKARVLTDVKTKSPRQSKVRAAVNTISNLVKGKKSAAQDKENRVPA